MIYPDNLRYTESHEWIRVDQGVATAGITFHAQDEIQEVVYVELPEVGTLFGRGDEFGVIESVKAAFDLYAPVSGEVVAANGGLEDHPEWVNESPYDQGWMIKIRMTDETEVGKLMDAAAYQEFLSAEAES